MIGSKYLAGCRISAMIAVALITASAMAGEVPPTAHRINVPGSPVIAETWTETAANGATTPFYRISLDGVRFSEPQATSYELLLTGLEFTPGADAEAVPPFLAAGPGSNVYLVQYYTQPLDAYRAVITDLGGVVYKYVAHNAEVVAMAPEVRDAVAGLPFVRWVGAYHPAYKLEPAIREQLASPFPDLEPARYSLNVLQRGPAQQEALRAKIEALGGTVHFITPEGHRMEATLLPGVLTQLAQADEVDFVDRWLGWGGHDMNNGRGPAGHDADYLESVAGFKGAGVRGEVFDTGVRSTHVDFQNPAPIFHTRNGSSTSHGTSVFGIVFGKGIADPKGRGLCPANEQGIFADYAQVTQFGGNKTRHQHTQELVDPQGPYRAVFQTSSVGSPQITTYSTISAEVDDYLFLYDLLSTQSQSNTGNQNSRPQAWAKNIVSVGAFNHLDDANRANDGVSGTSRGPASDGRIKPDLCAYYEMIYTTSSSSDTSYTTGFGGTSGATPMNCGTFGLMFEMWHKGVWPGHGGKATVFESRPKMATAKALMINTAFRYKCSSTDPGEPNTPAYTGITRYMMGWGQSNVRNLYDTRAQTFIVDETDVLLPTQTRTYFTRVPANTPFLRVTMVYTDLKGDPAVQSQHRVNDLSLKVTHVDSNTFWWGNNGLVDSSWSSPGGVANTKDTVENVFIQNPAQGMYRIQVIGTEIVKDSHPETPDITDADYALVINGGVTMRLGDLNCDGQVDFGDINPFVLALSDPDKYKQQYPDCDIMNGDCNGDGSVDFGDVNPFVALLSGN